MFLQLICCAVIGVFGVKGQTFCSNEQDTKIQSCISNSSDFCSLVYPQVLNFVDKPINGFCSKKTEFISVMNCVYGVVRTCFDGIFTSLHPTNEINQETLDNLCSQINSFNVSCLEIYIRNRDTCRFQGLDSFLLFNLTYERGKAYACGLRKNDKKCSEDSTELDKCPETKKIYQELKKLRNPDICGGEAGYESGVFGLLDQTENKDTNMNQSENKAPPLHQSVVLLTTSILMKIIF